MDPKSSQNRSKIVPKSVQNRSKIGPESSQNGLRSRLRFRTPFWSDFGPILAPTWGHLGGQVAAMLGKKSIFGGSGKAPENEHDFQHPSGPSWDRFWDDFWSQNRPKIGPEAVSRASEQKSKNLQKTMGFSMFFGVRGGRKSIKNRLKSHLK